MIRTGLFLAFLAISGSAMSFQGSNTNAYNVGKMFLETLQDLTAQTEYSEVQRKLKTNENPEVRIALNNAFVKSANGESQLNMREVVKAFEEISQKNNFSADEVLRTITNDPLYLQVAKQLSQSKIYNEEEKKQRVGKSLFSN